MFCEREVLLQQNVFMWPYKILLLDKLLCIFSLVSRIFLLNTRVSGISTEHVQPALNESSGGPTHMLF